ncbi:MAG: hypothetical protein P0107_01200 [Nitrosomonas sp.]|nr:hypothetical protein [Nitrosomonas sp.]
MSRWPILKILVTALDLMLSDDAYGFVTPPPVTVSTSGLVPALDRLRERCQWRSRFLHASNDALRDKLVPINKKASIRVQRL